MYHWDHTSQTPLEHVSHGAFFTHALASLTYNKVWTFRFYEAWDHTLGYDGEGPMALSIVSQNLRGALMGTTWEDAVRACKYRKAHVVCFQEINLKRGDPRMQRLVSVAKREGFSASFSFTPVNTAVGGTATLVSDSLQCTRMHHRAICQGSCGVLTLRVPGLATPSNKIRVVNIYGAQSSRERIAQFKTLSRHVNKWTMV